MRNIRIEKLTLNIGAGKDQNVLEKGLKLLKNITKKEPVKTFTSKRIPGWGIRPGLPIGCKITLRGKHAKELLQKLLDAKDNLINPKQFDENGNLSFGVPEYIDITDVEYDPDIGIMGLEVCVTFERPGFRIKRRKLQKRKINHRHAITKEESMDFMKNNFKIYVEEAE